MLALGTPVVLCITVLSVLILSGTLHIGLDSSENDDLVVDVEEGLQDVEVQDEMESVECPYVKVEIETWSEFQRYSQTLTDENEVIELFCVIQDFFDNMEVVVQENAPGFEEIQMQLDREDDSFDLSESSSLKKMEYVIRFTEKNGSDTIYVLNDGMLINWNTKEILYLKQEELCELKSELGLSE